jgi:predicted RNA-binding protein with RPS1 domain
MSDPTTSVMTEAAEPQSASTTTDPAQTVAPVSNSTVEIDPMELAMQQMPPLDEIEVPGNESEPRRSGRGSRSSDSSELRPGQVVTGTVVHIDHEGVLVDIGMKSEGLIRPNELSREPINSAEDVVAVGDRIEVLVLDPEGRDGNVLLSKKRADFEKAWDKVQEALGDGRTLQAMVSDRVKGGLVVDLGIRGFVPASHVGNGKLKNLEKFVGTSVPLKVLEVDRQNRKVVLSHRLATEEEREKEKDATIGSLGEGQVRTGTIRRVTDYGAFVDLGGIDGLLHVSEMSWTRVKHPSDVVKVGDSVQVQILKLNLEQGRVSLGMRQIQPDPWHSVAEKYHVNDEIEGEVTRLVPFGAFVLLEGDIEGIIPNSELAHRRIATPSDVVEVGQKVKIKVIDVRADERRLTLSLRALQPRDAEVERTPRPAGTPGTPEEAGTTVRREKREGRRRDRDGEDEAGNFANFVPRSGGGGGMTLGDMFPELLTASRGPAKKERGPKRRRDEDEDEDLSDIEIDDVETGTEVDAEADTEGLAEAATDTNETGDNQEA